MFNTSKSSLTRIGAVAFAGAVLVGFAAPALAANGDVVRRGGCSGSSDWKLKAGPQDNRIEVEGEVDSNVNDQNWKWKLLHNGEVSAHGTATTGSRSGSYNVRRLMVDLSGTDRIGWRATNPATGEVCKGSLGF